LSDRSLTRREKNPCLIAEQSRELFRKAIYVRLRPSVQHAIIVHMYIHVLRVFAAFGCVQTKTVNRIVTRFVYFLLTSDNVKMKI
jgi:hypothetical protein